MTKLEQAWREWRSLSSADRAKFLSMLRQVYSAEREMALRRRNSGVAHGARASGLADLRLAEVDFREAAPLPADKQKSSATSEHCQF